MAKISPCVMAGELTPVSADPLEVMMSGLSQSMTGLKLAPAAGNADENNDVYGSDRILKRSADLLTVEGSPVNPQLLSKRLDTTATPHADKFNVNAINSTALREWQECAKSMEKGKLERSLGNSNGAGRDHTVLIVSANTDTHVTGEHQENALRTELLIGDNGCLRRASLQSAVRWAGDSIATPAPCVDLLRVHDFEYLHHMQTKCAMAQQALTQSAPQPQSSIICPLPPFYAPVGQLDNDTPLGPQSLEAATRFCGSAMWAVDAVMGGVTLSQDRSSASAISPSCADAVSEGSTPPHTPHPTRCFVIGRPPGHHAGPHGCVPALAFSHCPQMASSGFCLLNTVAVAAAYARHKYGRLALMHTPPLPKPRVAIVDIDIHHGNGTEEIVRNLTPHMVPLPLPSSWPPQWKQCYKPWLDETDPKETFFGSVHLFAGEAFYPCSGRDEVSAVGTAVAGAASSYTVPAANVVNVALTPIGPGPWDPKTRAKLTPAQMKQLSDAASAEFRDKVSRMLLPALHAFRPTLLFISSGFDAHYDDLYHFLTEADFHWITGKFIV